MEAMEVDPDSNFQRKQSLYHSQVFYNQFLTHLCFSSFFFQLLFFLPKIRMFYILSLFKLVKDERFEIKMEKYTGQQYSQIYFARLHKMRTILYSLVEKWKPHLPGNSFFIFVLVLWFFLHLLVL